VGDKEEISDNRDNITVKLVTLSKFYP